MYRAILESISSVLAISWKNMDKNFEPIEQLYLSQAFDTESDEEQMLTECKMIARTYALAENAVVSMGDNRRNCSYCYFGGVPTCWAFRRRNGSASCLRFTRISSSTVATPTISAGAMQRRLPSFATSPVTLLPSTIAIMYSATTCG